MDFIRIIFTGYEIYADYLFALLGEGHDGPPPRAARRPARAVCRAPRRRPRPSPPLFQPGPFETGPPAPGRRPAPVAKALSALCIYENLVAAERQGTEVWAARGRRGARREGGGAGIRGGWEHGDVARRPLARPGGGSLTAAQHAAAAAPTPSRYGRRARRSRRGCRGPGEGRLRRPPAARGRASWCRR